MAKICYHNDDDGRLSAAIARHHILPAGTLIEESDFSVYHHDRVLEIPEFHKDEHVIMVDLALDKVTFKYLKAAVKAGANVLHIDHHKTTKEFMQNATNAQLKILNKITKFYDTTRSASMLTWFYSCAPEDLKPNHSSFGYYINDGATGFFLDSDYDKDVPPAIHRIPPVVKYVDDYDVKWPHRYDDTDAFHYGFMQYGNLHPIDEMWNDFLYDYTGIMYIDEVINRGKIIETHEYNRNDRIAKANAFEARVFGENAIVLESPERTSKSLGSLYNEYPISIVYHRKGSFYQYSIYNNASIKLIDVSLIASYFGGGGHAGAAGFICKYDIFTTKNAKRLEYREIPWLMIPRKK